MTQLEEPAEGREAWDAARKELHYAVDVAAEHLEHNGLPKTAERLRKACNTLLTTPTPPPAAPAAAERGETQDAELPRFVTFAVQTRSGEIIGETAGRNEWDCWCRLFATGRLPNSDDIKADATRAGYSVVAVDVVRSRARPSQ